MKVKTN